MIVVFLPYYVAGNAITFVPTGRTSGADADARRRDVRCIFGRTGRGRRPASTAAVLAAGTHRQQNVTF